MEAAACLECGAGLFSEAGSDSDIADCRSCPGGQYLVQAASGARICQDSPPSSGALPECSRDQMATFNRCTADCADCTSRLSQYTSGLNCIMTGSDRSAVDAIPQQYATVCTNNVAIRWAQSQ